MARLLKPRDSILENCSAFLFPRTQQNLLRRPRNKYQTEVIQLPSQSVSVLNY